MNTKLVIAPAVQASECSLRAMDVSDIKAIMKIERRAYEFPWTEGNFWDCISAGYHCRVLIYDDAIVGYSIFSSAAGEAHILNICVDPQFHRRGWGRLLLEQIMAEIEQQDVDMVLLEVRASNRVANKLYLSVGFNEVGQRKNYYPAANGREDAIVMVRQIIK